MTSTQNGLPRYVREIKLPSGARRYAAWIPLGKRGQKKWTKRCDSPDQAVRMRERMLELMKELPDDVMTLGAAVDAVKKELAGARRDGHQRWFDTQTKVLLAELGKSTPMVFLSRKRLEAFRDRMAKKVAPGTIVHYRKALSMVVRYAIDEGQIQQNPLRRMRWPSPEQKEKRAYTRDEMRKILEQVRDADRHADADLIEFLFGTGLRRAELARLHVKDIDLVRTCMWVQGKTGNERVAFGAHLKPLIERMIERALPDGRLVRDVNAVSHVFTRWRQNLGLDEFSPHSMRHSFVTALVDAGLPVQKVQRLARHKTIQMTMRYYQGRTDEQEALAALAL